MLVAAAVMVLEREADQHWWYSDHSVHIRKDAVCFMMVGGIIAGSCIYRFKKEATGTTDMKGRPILSYT